MHRYSRASFHKERACTYQLHVASRDLLPRRRCLARARCAISTFADVLHETFLNLLTPLVHLVLVRFLTRQHANHPGTILISLPASGTSGVSRICVAMQPTPPMQLHRKFPLPCTAEIQAPPISSPQVAGLTLPNARQASIHPTNPLEVISAPSSLLPPRQRPMAPTWLRARSTLRVQHLPLRNLGIIASDAIR